MRVNGVGVVTQNQINKKKQAIIKAVISQQEKKQHYEHRRIQRLKRFEDFKQLLNSFIPDQSKQSESSDVQEYIIINQYEQQENCKEETKQSSKKRIYTSESDVKQCKQAESKDQCLRYLDPWFRR